MEKEILIFILLAGIIIGGVQSAAPTAAFSCTPTAGLSPLPGYSPSAIYQVVTS